MVSSRSKFGTWGLLGDVGGPLLRPRRPFPSAATRRPSPSAATALSIGRDGPFHRPRRPFFDLPAPVVVLFNGLFQRPRRALPFPGLSSAAPVALAVSLNGRAVFSGSFRRPPVASAAFCRRRLRGRAGLPSESMVSLRIAAALQMARAAPLMSLAAAAALFSGRGDFLPACFWWPRPFPGPLGGSLEAEVDFPAAATALLMAAVAFPAAWRASLKIMMAQLRVLAALHMTLGAFPMAIAALPPTALTALPVTAMALASSYDDLFTANRLVDWPT